MIVSHGLAVHHGLKGRIIVFRCYNHVATLLDFVERGAKRKRGANRGQSDDACYLHKSERERSYESVEEGDAHDEISSGYTCVTWLPLRLGARVCRDNRARG